jgi:hypothetical protein
VLFLTFSGGSASVAVGRLACPDPITGAQSSDLASFPR